MIKIQMVETFDGIKHESEKAALKHLNKIYGDKLLSISHKIIQLNRFDKIAEFIDSNLELFNELSKIKKDMKMEEEEELVVLN